jgi:hypothetical protein
LKSHALRLGGLGDTIVIKRLLAVSALACSLALAAPAAVLGASGPAQPAAKEYQNCTKLNKDYPHGVGKPNATDKVSGNTDPVRNFKRSKPLYNANSKSDRDKDGIACEKL